MKHATKLLLAAALTFGGVGATVVPAYGEEAKADAKADAAKARAEDKADRAADRAAAAAAPKLDEAGVKAVQAFLAETTAAALTSGRLDDVVDRYTKDDRDRMNKADTAKVDTADLDAQVVAFRKNWRDKYGKDFALTDETARVVFNNVTTDGALADQARTAGARVGGRDESTPGAVKSPSEGKVTGTHGDFTGKSPQIGGRDLPPGPGERTRADQLTVKFPASHGIRGATVDLVKEGGSWRIDGREEMSKAELRNNLLQHVTKLNGSKADWPADVNEAYRAVSHHVLLALADEGRGTQPENIPGGNDAGRGAGDKAGDKASDRAAPGAAGGNGSGGRTDRPADAAPANRESR